MDSCCMFINWKSEHHMSDQKIFVSAHKKNFDLYDRSESIFDRSERFYEHS